MVFSSLPLYGGRTPRGVRGLKLSIYLKKKTLSKSHPARGAWIETITTIINTINSKVAPREGCVD